MAKIMKIAVFLDISVKLLLKRPLHNRTHLFIKAHTKPNIQAGAGGQMPHEKFLFLNLYKQTSEE
jgi:hypothetical protein